MTRNRVKTSMRKFLRDVWKGLRAIAIAVTLAVIVSILLWPFGFRADFKASLFKILDHVLVFQKVEHPPKAQIHLFSQYPYEYGLKHPEGWIEKQEVLEIREQDKPLWLGIFNSEPRALHGVRFILSPPSNVEPVGKEAWSEHWLAYQFGQTRDTRYQYREWFNIPPHTGMVITAPIQFRFPQSGDYRFAYVVITDEYGPYMGSFVVRKKD